MSYEEYLKQADELEKKAKDLRESAKTAKALEEEKAKARSKTELTNARRNLLNAMSTYLPLVDKEFAVSEEELQNCEKFFIEIEDAVAKERKRQEDKKSKKHTSSDDTLRAFIDSLF